MRKSHEIGILELGLRRSASGNCDGMESLRNVIDLAGLIDSLGYDRLWLAEHRTLESCYGSPLALLSVVAATTRNLRVGTGGLLFSLNDHDTVVDAMAALDMLFPGRIECGVCRGPGKVYSTQSGAEEFEGSSRRQREESIVTLREEMSGWRYGPQPRSSQTRECGVDVWLLGTSRGSAEAAARLGVPFAYSLCHRSEEDPDAVVLAYHNAVARRGGASRLLIAASIEVVDVENGYPRKEWASCGMLLNGRGRVDECVEHLLQVTARFAASGVLVADLIESHPQRCQTYTMLMQEFARSGYDNGLEPEVVK